MSHIELACCRDTSFVLQTDALAVHAAPALRTVIAVIAYIAAWYAVRVELQSLVPLYLQLHYHFMPLHSLHKKMSNLMSTAFN
jgi:hypothetical protein